MAKYDLVIIGSGPGGYVAAIRAAQWGLKTAVVEKDPFLGGTCLHVGCIPTKVLLHHADIYDHFKRAEEFGFEVKDVKVNWPAILARKDKIVKKHALGISALFKKNKVESITGWGKIAGPGRVSVEKDGKTTEIETTYTMLATGSEARSLPGLEIDGKTVLTNREILDFAGHSQIAGRCWLRRGRGRICVGVPHFWHGGDSARDFVRALSRWKTRTFQWSWKKRSRKREFASNLKPKLKR